MYIIVPNKRAGGTSEDLYRCLRTIEGMPDCRVTKVVGKIPDLDRLYIEATPDAIDKLRQDYGSQLIIEPDSPLKPLG